MEQIKILIKIAKELNSKKVRWGVGGSLLLKLHGLDCKGYDIDIVIDSDDIVKAMDIMDNISTKVSFEDKEEYLTDHFSTFKLDGVKIDFFGIQNIT
jgi:predicted nucleotidyltransferase